jgi:light-regulated signal transduction histidine kinase (bacteriophytochrome)
MEEDYGPQLSIEARRVLSVIKDNTTKMGQLIDDLLMFSRMGRNELVKVKIDTSAMVSDIIKSVDHIDGQPVINWVIHDLPNIEGDRAMINQVWVNLISNAIKYSKQNPNPRIEIGSLVNKGQRGFFVKDNGVGFDAKYIDKLFRVFQRLHSSHEFEGTGIGLAIVEKIVAKHGGSVWATGELNKGATFFFSLPVAEI